LFLPNIEGGFIMIIEIGGKKYDTVKLPKWANKILENRENYINHLKDKIEKLQNPDGSTSKIKYFSSLGHDATYIPDDATIIFCIQETDKSEEQIRIEMKKDYKGISVLKITSLGTSLFVKPKTDNQIILYQDTNNIR
jgi:hypothetical protein